MYVHTYKHSKQFTDKQVRLIDNYREATFAWQLALGITAYRKNQYDMQPMNQLKMYAFSDYRSEICWPLKAKSDKYLNKIMKEMPAQATDIIKAINDEIEEFRQQCCISTEYWKEGNR